MDFFIMADDGLQRDSLFQALIATAVDGIVVINAHGIVQIYGDACEKLFGYTAGEVVNQNVKMLMPQPYRDQHDQYIQNYHVTGEKQIIGIGREVVGRRKDGSTFPMYLSVGEGTLGGNRIFVGIIQDLTARQTATRRMQELQGELLHVSRLSAMGQMTAALAHELNQPLTAIMNYITAARRTITGREEEQIVRGLELIDKAAAQTTRAGQIIRRLRDFVEKRDADRSIQSLNPVVEESIALGFVGAADANVKVYKEFDTTLPPVMIDKIQIQQVLLNLIRNSIEAMRTTSNRTMTLRTARGEGNAVDFSICDTGPGLPPEVVSRLFQPFVTTKEKGMGIGLSICQSIVEAHGGRIWATANDTEGVTFHIRLPAASDVTP